MVAIRMIRNIFEHFTNEVVDLASIFIIPTIKTLNEGLKLNNVRERSTASPGLSDSQFPNQVHLDKPPDFTANVRPQRISFKKESQGKLIHSRF